MIKHLLCIIFLSGCGSSISQSGAYTGGYQTGRPVILTIGDSITGGWNLQLTSKLQDEYSVRRITVDGKPTGWLDNCRNTSYTLRHLDQWFKWHPHPAIVTWGNGIWDASTTVTEGQDPRNYGVTNAEYEINLKSIALRLKSESPRVIFVTTTSQTPTEKRSEHSRSTEFNEIAKRVLPPMGVEIFDLYDFTIDHGPDWHDGSVHFNWMANELIADRIAKRIKKNE